MMKTAAGEQVVVLPDWAFKTLSLKGKPEDVINFSKMRQWFTQEQLVAIDRFSDDGFSIFWSGGALPSQGDATRKYTRSIGYIWYFPDEAGEALNGSETDKYAKNQISRLGDNREYTAKLVDQYILSELREPPKDTIDLHQSYSVYSASDKLIVVALNQGVLSPVIFKRKEELRLSIMRSVIAKLQEYYDLPVVHSTNWFEWYLTELDRLK